MNKLKDHRVQKKKRKSQNAIHIYRHSYLNKEKKKKKTFDVEKP